MEAPRIFANFDGDDPGTRVAKVRAFQIVVALVIVAEYWIKALARWDGATLDQIVPLAAASVLSLWVVGGQGRRWAFAGLALLEAWYVWDAFPLAGNHRYLGLVFLALFALLDDERPEDRRLLLRAVRWMVVVVLFWSGMQKLIHGYWFQGTI